MTTGNDTGGYQVPEIDRFIHEPARYNIMALLYVVERAEFLFVQNQTRLTPGNLSSHVSKLDAVGYVAIEKEFIGKMPKTFLSLTEKGRGAFETYRGRMKDLFTSPPAVPEDSGDNARFRCISNRWKNQEGNDA